VAPPNHARRGNAAGSADGKAPLIDAFWAWDFELNRYYVVEAERIHASDSVWLYLEAGSTVAPGQALALAELFEDSVSSRLRRAFGTEPRPGIDGEDAVTILLLDIHDALYYDLDPHTYYSGYFDPINERRQADLEPEMPHYRSNEREMIYVDIAPTAIGGRVIRQAMAHEFTHLIQWYHDESEEEWLVEALCELGVQLAGLGHPAEHVQAFLADPDLALTSWVGDVRDYGKVYMFALYLHEQLSPRNQSWLRALTAHPGHGIASIKDTAPIADGFPELLRDFAVALYVDAPGDGRFGFRSLELRDSPSAGEFRRPLPAPLPLREGTGADVEMAPWSWRGLSLLPGDTAQDVELVPESDLCIGWLRPGSARGPETRCVAGGQPVAWSMQASAAGEGPLYVIAANASALGNDARLSSSPYLSARTARSALYLPLTVVH